MIRSMRARTILLYSETAGAGGDHAVASPGGYEVWAFEAIDLSNDRRVVVTVGYGGWDDRDYARQYRRYVRRPTRAIPPVPGDYGQATVAVYGGQREMSRQVWRVGSLKSQRAGLDIVAEGLRVTGKEDGTIEFVCEREGNQLHLLSSPAAGRSGAALPLISSEMAHGRHRWVAGDGICRVSGTVGGRSFEGRGYFDQYYGTRPLGDGVARWISGRVLTEDRAVAFQILRSRDGEQPDESQLLEYVEEGVTSREICHKLHWTGWPGFRYPKRIQFSDWLTLDDVRVISCRRDEIRLRYRAGVRAIAGVALCTVRYLSRNMM